MIRIITGQELYKFKAKYTELAGLSIPNEYLSAHKVYGIYQGIELVGGFIIAESSVLRTVEVFSSPDLQSTLYSELNELGSFTEICCFWLSHAIRKKLLLNAYAWLHMAAMATLTTKANMVIFGTNSYGLAKMYAYPVNSLFFHTDVIGGKSTYIFIARKKHFFSGVFSIIWAKLWQREVPDGLKNKLQLTSAL